MEKIENISAGQILKEEFMTPLGLSGNALAKKLGVPANRINSIINGSRAITADTAILLGNFFNTSAKFWLNLQIAYDLEEAIRRREKAA